MFFGRRRERLLDELFSRAAVDGVTSRLLFPIAKFGDGAGGQTPNVLVVDNKDGGILLFLAQQYLELYRHYDNQRHQFASILVFAVAGFSLAPSQLKPNLISLPILVLASYIVILLLSNIGKIANRKLRFRMKTAYHRFSLIRTQLGKSFPNLEINDNEGGVGNTNKGTELARDEMHDEGEPWAKDSNDKKKKLQIETHTRGELWDRLPKVVEGYAHAYLIISLFTTACLHHSRIESEWNAVRDVLVSSVKNLLA